MTDRVAIFGQQPTKVRRLADGSDVPAVCIAGNESAPVPVAGSVRSCVGRVTLSVTTGAVVSLTPPAGAIAAMIQADGSAVSMTLDGTSPTATVGTRIDDGVIMHIDSALANVKLIARSATTNVQVAYFNKA